MRNNNTSIMKHTEQEDYATTANHSTTNSRTQSYTSTMQKLVSNLRSRQRAPRQLQETTITTTRHSSRLQKTIPQEDPKTIPVLTAVDFTTQLCMAVLVPDKPSMMAYMINNLQACIFECGRTQGILQSDNEDTLNALLKATESKVGSMTVRHSPFYTAATVKEALSDYIEHSSDKSASSKRKLKATTA